MTSPIAARGSRWPHLYYIAFLKISYRSSINSRFGCWQNALEFMHDVYEAANYVDGTKVVD